MMTKLTIAVDFDGTLVENRYPEVGEPLLFAFEALKKLQQDGHQLILWIYRHDEELRDAVAFCESKGVQFYAINKSYPEEEYDPLMSRKILADLFIDDRNINGFPPWVEIYQQLSNPESTKSAKKKSAVFKFLKKHHD